MLKNSFLFTIILLCQLSISPLHAQQSVPIGWSVSACSGDIRGRPFACTTISKSGPQWCKDINVSGEFHLYAIELGQGWVICDYIRSLGGQPYGARQWGGIHVGSPDTPKPPCPTDTMFDSGLQRCVSTDDPKKKCTVGNPIVIADGVKVQEETDITIPYNNFMIPITRFYNSETALRGVKQSAAQQTWTFSFRDKIDAVKVKVNIGGTIRYEYHVDWIRPNSEEKQFTGENIDSLSSLDRSILSIRPLVSGSHTSGFEIKDRNGDYYTFNGKGWLTKFESVGKYAIDFTYLNSNTEVVAKIGGSEIFRYIKSFQDNVTSVKLPQNKIYTYAYDSKYNLTSVKYPDTTLRRFHYENTAFPRALTGVTDREGIRASTWTYNTNGRAISSENVNGRHKHILEYMFETDPTDQRIIETNPLGKLTTYHFDNIDGIRKFTKMGNPKQNFKIHHSK